MAFERPAAAAVAWDEADATLAARAGNSSPARPGQIGGGTTEMARNVISERVLGMPREPAGDKDIAYRDVPSGPAAGR